MATRPRSLPTVKTADDTSHSPLASPSIDNGPSTTFTTLSRLLGATSSLSPEASRSSSFIYSRQLEMGQTTDKKPPSLSDHLLTRGLRQGRYSDITVHAFGVAYPLHRIILDRAPFFATALSGPWLESKSNEITIHPEEIDSNITQNGFELALQRLYRGVPDLQLEDEHCVETFATGSWLEMPELIDSSVESIIRGMTPSNLGYTISIVTKSYYGEYGHKILAAAQAMLCRDGWKMPLTYWDSVPGDYVALVLGSDGLFVDGELERFELAVRILNYRLKARWIEHAPWPPSLGVNLPRRALRPGNNESVPTELSEIYTHVDIKQILWALDTSIHYMHLTFEELQHIRTRQDILGVPLVPEEVISNALWQQMELRHRVLNARMDDQELGFTEKITAKQIKHIQSIEQEEDAPQNTSNSLDSHLQRHWIPAADGNIVMGVDVSPFTPSFFGESSQIKDSDWWKERQDLVRSAEKTAFFSSLPPLRFSAEFPSPKVLKEKKRIYSRTVFYAGSMWNVYIQKIASARSTKQLGVYLHRVRDEELELIHAAAGQPSRGIVESHIGRLEQSMTARLQAQERDDLDGDSDRAEEHISIVVSDHDVATSGDDVSDKRKAKSRAVVTLPKYMDVRPVITTYFKIFSPSRGGRMLSVYESAPDTFKLSQSWGWRSSTLMLDEGFVSSEDSTPLDDMSADYAESSGVAEGVAGLSVSGAKEEGDTTRKAAKSLGDGKLRFMVVIGVL